mgnify:CR=1 FL=1
MGLGGHLIWTAVFRNLQMRTGNRIFICRKPKFSDLLHGCLYDRSFCARDDPVFRNNPRLDHPATQIKAGWEERVDSIAADVIRRLGLETIYERVVHYLSQRSGQHWIHLDLRIHHYVEKELPERYIWRTGGHAVDLILKNFNVQAFDHRPELYFTNEEESEAFQIRQAYGLTGDYICIEPHTKEDYFGDLRAWPMERWQAVIDQLAHADVPPHKVVQIGASGKPSLKGVIDLSGRIPFRIAALLMRDCVAFLGTDGGLMHASAAVGAPAVILWSGVNLPTLLGYPEMHTIVRKVAECSPCGLKGGCAQNRKCMLGIEVDEVLQAVIGLLKQRKR